MHQHHYSATGLHTVHSHSSLQMAHRGRRQTPLPSTCADRHSAAWIEQRSVIRAVQGGTTTVLPEWRPPIHSVKRDRHHAQSAQGSGAEASNPSFHGFALSNNTLGDHMSDMIVSTQVHHTKCGTQRLGPWEDMREGDVEKWDQFFVLRWRTGRGSGAEQRSANTCAGSSLPCHIRRLLESSAAAIFSVALRSCREQYCAQQAAKAAACLPPWLSKAIYASCFNCG